MTATTTSIVNVGLGRALIRARISDYATDTTAEAKIARDCYEDLRDSLLRTYLWSFAKKRVQLAALSTAPAFGYDYAFGLPSDYLRTISVHPADSNASVIEYKLESVVVSSTPTPALLTSATTVYLRYVAKVTDVSIMDPLFRDCFEWQLGEHFALAIKQNTQHAEYCRRMFAQTLGRARSTNAIEDWPEEFPEGSWVTTRLSESGDY